MDFFARLLADDFMPHGQCWSWDPEVVWLHVVSDLLIALAYYSIPVTLWHFARRRRDIPFHWVPVMFAAFIFACGTTHAMAVVTTWYPIYRLDGLIKLATAVISVATAMKLYPLMPMALAMKNPAELEAANRELERQIAERERAEQELKALNETLEQRVAERTAAAEERARALLASEDELRGAKEAAEYASRAKSDFLASMSHELRTPLNVIIGFAEVLEDETFGPLNPRQRRYAGNIVNSGRHLLLLINEILDLSKVEAGRMDLDLTRFAPAQALGDIVLELQPLADRKEISLGWEPAEPLPLLAADPARFRQVLLNLLSNAVKFTPEGGAVTVRAEAVTDEAIGPALSVSVSDTGIGLRPEDQARIFEAFERVDNSYARREEGTGLGLSLALKLVELHGGRIDVASEGEGRGSTFTVVLPLAGPAPPAVQG